MKTQFMDTKTIISSRERWLRNELEMIRSNHKVNPKIGIMLVTGDQIMMATAEKVAKLATKFGFEIETVQVAERNVDRRFAEKLSEMVSDDTFMGIWVATPRFDFPPYETICSIIPPEKDLAAIHQQIIGRYMFGKPSLIPPKVRAVHDLLSEYAEGWEEKGIVVVSTKNDGTRGFFGKYLAGYLYDLGATVQIRNVFGSTREKEQLLKLYNPFGEIVISALNTSNAIGGERLKKGSVVIDTGYNFQRSRLTGDVNIETAGNVCQMITSVPGGVDALIPVEIMINALDIVKTRVGIPRIKTDSDSLKRRIR